MYMYKDQIMRIPPKTNGSAVENLDELKKYIYINKRFVFYWCVMRSYVLANTFLFALQCFQNETFHLYLKNKQRNKQNTVNLNFHSDLIIFVFTLILSQDENTKLCKLDLTCFLTIHCRLARALQ